MTQTAPLPADVRDCRLYRFWVEHPVTGEEVLGYIGETVRQPFERLMEHVQTQPWIDTVTRWERDPIVYAGKQMVLEAEAAAIRAERPLLASFVQARALMQVLGSSGPQGLMDKPANHS